MACSVNGTQAAIFTPFHCGALLMSQCTPLTVSCLCFGCSFFVVVLFPLFGSGFGPLFVLVLVCLSCLLCFRPFLQWIMHRTSFLTSRQFWHVKLPPRCQLPLYQLVQEVKSCITTRRKPLWRWSKKKVLLTKNRPTRCHSLFAIVGFTAGCLLLVCILIHCTVQHVNEGACYAPRASRCDLRILAGGSWFPRR